MDLVECFRARYPFPLDDFQVEAMAAVGRPGPITVLPEDFQARESPNTRRPIREVTFEGPYRA